MQKLTIIVLVLVASFASAQELPGAAPEDSGRVLTWDFILSHAALAGATAFDTYLSQDNVGHIPPDPAHPKLHRCNLEASPFLGDMPLVWHGENGNVIYGYQRFRTVRASLMGVAEVGAIGGFDYLIRRNFRHSKIARAFTDALPIVEAQRHARAVAQWESWCP